MDGWARRYIVVTPDGVVLPCHQAGSIAGLTFETVRARPLAAIWSDSPALRAYRGDAWMPEPCRTCDERHTDFGGCRCQAFALLGDAGATDPACALSPRHAVVRRRARPGRRGRPPRRRRRRFACAGCERPHDAVIEVEDLTKTYGEVEAVRGIGFSVGAGEIFGFLGPNGAGKTTTIKILCTLLQPTSGRARLAGLDVATAPDDVRRRIGVIFQDPALDDRLTAEENLMLHAVAYRVPRGERAARIDEALRFVDLSRARPGSDADVLGRHEAPPRDRARADPPPGDPLPRRADHGPGSADAGAHLGGAAGAAARLRHDAVPDHALHGRGRELRSHRRHRPRQDRRAGHARRAEAAGGQGPGHGAERGARRAGAPPVREVRHHQHAGRRRAVFPGRGRRRVHRQAADQRPPGRWAASACAARRWTTSSCR